MANGTWAVDANGLWSTATNWSGSVIAVGSGDTANFTNNISANRTVTNTIGGTWTGTIGNINFSDNGAAGSSWIVSGASTITLASPAAASSITTLTPATISGPMTGSVDVYKYGTSTLTLSGTNTNLAASKSVYIAAGTLITSNAAAFSSTATFYVLSGATLNPTVALNRTGYIEGTGASGTGAITNANLFTGTATLSGNATLGVAASTAPDGTYNLNSYALTMTAYNNAAITHTISGTGTQVVFNVAFGANNTYNGTAQTYTVTDKVIVSGDTGTVRTYGIAPRNFGSSSNPVLVRNYGTVFVNATTVLADRTFDHNLTVEDGILASATASGTISLISNGNISITNGYNMYVTGFTSASSLNYLNGVISGGGNLVAGFLGGSYVANSVHVVNTSNTFTGTVEVLINNILYVYGNNSLGNPVSPSFIYLSGGSLLPASGTTVTLPTNRPVYATANMAFAIPSSDSLTINGSISADSATRTLTKSGTGTLGLGGTNTFGGTITHSGGTLALNSAGAIGGGGAYTMSAVATLDNQGGSAVTVSSNNSIALNANPTFAGTNNLTFGSGSSITIGTTSPRTFTINGTAPTTGSNGSTLAFNGNITSTGSTVSLGKDGAGRLTMGGSNALTTTSHSITAGIYQIRNANALGAAATNCIWTISSGATLEIGGSITVNSNKTIYAAGAGPIANPNGSIFFVDSGNTLPSTIQTTDLFTIGADTSAANNVVSGNIIPQGVTRHAMSSRTLAGSKITYSSPTIQISSFTQTGSTGTTVISTAVDNTSTITVSTGTLEIDTAGAFSGSGTTASVGATATLRIKRATGAFGSLTAVSVVANGNLQAGTADGKVTYPGNLTLGSSGSGDKAVIKFGTT